MTTTPDGFYCVETIFNLKTRSIEKDAILCPSCVARLVLTHDIWGEIHDTPTVEGRECDLCDVVQHD